MDSNPVGNGPQLFPVPKQSSVFGMDVVIVGSKSSALTTIKSTNTVASSPLFKSARSILQIESVLPHWLSFIDAPLALIAYPVIAG